jgi:hypothetical protein
MQGIQVFETLTQALCAGFTVYDRTPGGYLVRMRTAGGWAIAIVELRKHLPGNMQCSSAA